MQTDETKIDGPRSLERIVGRRVVALSAAGVANTANTQCNWILTAVCDDGSMWFMQDSVVGWCELPPIPQPPNSDYATGRNIG